VGCDSILCHLHMHAGWEPLIVNLGHVHRKQKRYSEATELFETALGLCPGQPGTYAALAYTYHIEVNPCSHTSLSSRDTVNI
jgi:uncharacterized protein HemY